MGACVLLLFVVLPLLLLPFLPLMVSSTPPREECVLLLLPLVVGLVKDARPTRLLLGCSCQKFDLFERVLHRDERLFASLIGAFVRMKQK